MTAPRELRTARLLLRSLQDSDGPALVRFAGAREIAATTVRIPHPYTDDDARSFLGHARESYREGRSIFLAITMPPDTELRGAVGLELKPPHGHAELGYWIAIPYWGKGFATEAAKALVAFGFNMLGLHRIYAHHFDGNVASGRVLEKIGMRHEGRFRQHVRKWDQYIDVENYGLLANEFLGDQ
jgi:RimJ/RimL family protein N-acetyltransferase